MKLISSGRAAGRPLVYVLVQLSIIHLRGGE